MTLPDACDVAACLLRLLSVLEIILPAGGPGVTDMVTPESVIRCLKQTDTLCHDIIMIYQQIQATIV